MEFETRAAQVEEVEASPAETNALENARRKARAVAAESSGRAVLAVDTMVSLDGRTYGKPADEAEARATLAALSGRTHEVTSGVCLIEADGERTAVASTRVEFRALSPETIEWYLGSGEWRERAGGYAIQGRGGALVSRIEGDYLNVVGLPVAKLLELAPWLLGT